ncbi:PREDICTED: PRUPE_5G033400 [Prunus dulcis]|uniref:PREDICTED: PRUPE_5G033400 n=1 Tax=Prunus dulcis TaxID=3755 RepID=A0A5E4GNR8_PRUDU|nr:uncharacterized protein LOC117628178 [Prunus dulcis]VVA41306.1 PREDICTED: PRUPE_5G033400 [Prunus dulcis]
MKKLKNLRQTDEESVELMSDDEIYDSVLSKVVGPPRSSYIRGLGAGPKTKTFKAGQCSHATIEEAKRRADEATKRADDAEKPCMLLANELFEMKENSEAQKYQLEGLLARQNETDALVKRLLEQLSSTSSSMRSDG